MRSRTIQSACALGRERFVAVCFDEANEDAADDPEASKQEVLFSTGHDRPVTISRRTQNVRLARVSSASDDTALLSRLGTVEYLSFAGESRGHEDITGAIAAGKSLPSRGYLNAIACIDDQLFACGMGGQVYARGADGTWSLISSSLCSSDPNERWFSNIQGLDKEHVFADGPFGQLYAYDGASWTKVASGTDAAIGEMVFLDADTIFIAGVRSTLLAGNARAGFHPIRVSARDLELYTICRYRDDIFISTGQGLFRLQRSRDGILSVDGDGIGERDVLSLQVVDDVMWCFGLKLVRRFDGERWARFDHIF